MSARPQCLEPSSRGPVEAVFDTTDATIAFKSGDLLYQTSGGYATPIGTVTVTTAFLGVSRQDKAAGVAQIFGNSSPGIIMVDPDGVYEFDRSDTVAMNLGEFVAPAGTATNSQLVAKGAGETVSIGRVNKAVPASASVTRLRVKIMSAVLPAAKTT